MNCPDEAALLAAFDPDEPDAQILEHLETCARCAERARAFESVRSHLHAFFERTEPEAVGDCPEDDMLYGYVVGKCGWSDARRIRRHMEECEACFLQAAEIRRSVAVHRPVRAPGHLVKRAKAMFESPRVRARPAPAARRTQYAFAAAIMICAVLLGTYFTQQGQQQPSPPEVPAPGPQQAPPEVIIPPPGESSPEATRGTSYFEELVFRYQVQGSARISGMRFPSERKVSLTSRDGYGLRFRVRQPGWVYVFEMDSRGQLALLFPSSRFQTGDNPVAKRDYIIPSDKSFFHLDENAGRETVYVVFAREQLGDWESLGPDAETWQGDAAVRLRAELDGMASGAAGVGGTECIKFEFDHAPSP